MPPIPIRLAVEDELSEIVLRRLLHERPSDYAIGGVFRKGGFGYLKRNCAAFNRAAKNCPFLLLTDLDQSPCPPALRACFGNQKTQVWSAAASDSRRDEGAYPQDTQPRKQR